MEITRNTPKESGASRGVLDGINDLEQGARIVHLIECLALSSNFKDLVVSQIKATHQNAFDVFERFSDPLQNEIKHIEMQLRQMANANLPWSEMKRLVWRKFRLEASNESAARLIEAVYLNGSIHDLADSLAVLNEESYEYFQFFDGRFREHLAFKLMQIGKTETLRIFVSPIEFEEFRLPIEHLYMFYVAQNSRSGTDAFMYFQRHESEIIEASQKYGEALSLGSSGIYLSMGQQAYSLGFAELAKRFLSQINPDQDEYSQSLQLQMVLQHDPDQPASQSYLRNLELASNWREKIDLIDQYISEARQRISEPDIRRPVVNQIVSDPLKFIPNIHSAISPLMSVIARNSDLNQSLPAILDVFKQKAIEFEVPVIESAFWQPVAEFMPPVSPLHTYWRGVAKLHLFTAAQSSPFELLWQARQMILRACEDWPFPMIYTWKELHQHCLRHLSRSPHLSERERSQNLTQLRIAADPKDVSLHDIEQFIDQLDQPQFQLMEQLEEICRLRGARTLELKILSIRGRLSHYRNQDLDRLWNLSNELNDFDLSWRVATVLEGRGILSERFIQPWSISGEKRSDYPFYIPREEHLDLCFKGLSREEKRLVKSCLTLAHKLPELLLSIDPELRSGKANNAGADSFEFLIDKALNSIKFLPQQRKIYRLGNDGLLSGSIYLPGFVQVLPSNVWSYTFLKLGERLGLNAWAWKLSSLQKALEGILPRVGYEDRLSFDAKKVAKWLKCLSLEERTSWNDLIHLQNKLTDEMALNAIAKFLLRLCLVIHPSHVQALKSLRVMRVPVQLVWDLEAWMLSAEYSQIRKAFEANSRVFVPANLRTVRSLCRVSNFSS